MKQINILSIIHSITIYLLLLTAHFIYLFLFLLNQFFKFYFKFIVAIYSRVYFSYHFWAPRENSENVWTGEATNMLA